MLFLLCPALLYFIFLGTKPVSPVVQEKQEDIEEDQPRIQTTLPAISYEHTTSKPRTDKSTIPKRVRPSTYINLNRWNFSTHAKPNPYIPDLADAYPRDPFTKMPPRRDAVEVYRLLQSIHYVLRKLFLIYPDKLFRNDLR